MFPPHLGAPQAGNCRLLCGAVFTAGCLVLGIAPGSFGQAPAPSAINAKVEQYTQAFNGAVSAFNAQNWMVAAQGFESAIKILSDETAPQMATLMYMAGSSYFNAASYDRAIEYFTKFLAKFPNAENGLEVRLALAQANLLSQKFPEAIKIYQELEAVPALREQSLKMQVFAYREMQKPDEAIGVLEKMIAPEIKTQGQASGAIMLAEMYAAKKQTDKVLALVRILSTKTALVDNVVALNAISVKLGDELLEQKKYADALAMYRAVRPRAEVIRIQNAKIAALTARMEANIKAAIGNATLMAQAGVANSQIKADLEQAKKLLDDYTKLPDFTPALLLRTARCWYEGEKKWEAIVVYDRVCKLYPDAPEHETALFGMIIASADVARVKKCQEFCEQYLKKYPTGPNAGTVGYLSGAVALQAQDYAGAVKYFGTMLQKVPNSQFKTEMRFLLANARFMQGQFEDASKDYRKYLSDYPAGKDAEEAQYRFALCSIFAGKYEEALDLLTGYLKKFPSGNFVGDCRYRISVCKYAASEYPEVAKECREWLKDFIDHPQEGEVQALLGDALAAQGQLEDAIKAYQRSYQVAGTDEVLNYSLFEASKHLQKLGNWKEVSRMFEEFLHNKPDHMAAVAAMYWIGKAKAKEGRTDEAKTFLVENLRKYIADPKRESVESLLTLLAQLCAKRPPPPLVASAQPASAAGTPKPAAVPVATPLPPYDAVGELNRQLAPIEDTVQPIIQARILAARAELARLLKHPAEAEEIMEEMAKFQPEELSSVLLAQAGDFLMTRGQSDRARAFFEKMKEDYPKSDYIEYAYVGLGQIALEKKEYAKALELFEEVIDKIGASLKLKEATIGRAQALLELNRYDEAKTLFEQVASVREWRGDSTAYAIFTIGEIEFHKGQYAEAIARYRRVFVAYQKYLPWVAKSYLRAADSFEKMGKRQDAIDNLKEMLRNDKLVKFPEMEEAKERLRKWGVSA
jgi:TolA-binding protein